MHIPIMLKEVINSLSLREGDFVVDATIGFGGHSSEISKIAKVIGIDQDIEALRYVEEKVPNISLFKSNFADIDTVLELANVKEVSGILADIGISSYQIDNASRGFSYMNDGPLDMRMDKESELTAEKILNSYSEEELANIFFKYGEERNSRRISKAIVDFRKKENLSRSSQLVKIVTESSRYNMASVRRVFQALRVEVNRELERLEIFLKKSEKLLKKGGRLAIITFHTLEDRIVKNFIKSSTLLKEVNKKVITPTDEELSSNSRARSAKLRIAEKL